MKKDQFLGQARHLLTVVGTVVVMLGIGDESLVQESIGAVMAIAAVVWSWKEKSGR